MSLKTVFLDLDDPFQDCHPVGPGVGSTQRQRPPNAQGGYQWVKQHWS